MSNRPKLLGFSCRREAALGPVSRERPGLSEIPSNLVGRIVPGDHSLGAAGLIGVSQALTPITFSLRL